MSALSDLSNVGKVLEENLLSVGIETPEQLRKIGAKEVFMRIRAHKDPTACLHMLYGLQGAVEGIPDKHLSEAVKQDLKSFFKTL
jgi:DNA transformation protein